MGKQNERKKLIREIEKDGYTVQRTRSGHYKVTVSAVKAADLRRKGLDTEKFPPFVMLSCSPSDSSSDRNARSDMRKIGYSG